MWSRAIAKQLIGHIGGTFIPNWSKYYKVEQICCQVGKALQAGAVITK